MLGSILMIKGSVDLLQLIFLKFLPFTKFFRTETLHSVWETLEWFPGCNTASQLYKFILFRWFATGCLLIFDEKVLWKEIYVPINLMAIVINRICMQAQLLLAFPTERLYCFPPCDWKWEIVLCLLDSCIWCMCACARVQVWNILIIW